MSQGGGASDDAGLDKEFESVGEAPAPGRRAIVRQVRGGGASTEKGLAPLHSMTAQTRDGKTFEFGRVPTPGEQQVPLRVLHTASHQKFDTCPICLKATPETKEHVPPEGVGGTVMTYTCTRCNSQLGALTDKDLVDWFDDAFVPVRVAHPDVRGARKTSRVLRRQTPDGQFVLIPEGFFDPEVANELSEGAELTFDFTIPHPDRVRLSVLKNAYLSACLITESILATPEAEQVRQELMAVRDKPRDEPIGPLGPAARSIRFTKADGTNYDGRITLVQVPDVNETTGFFGISMMGNILASWVFGGGFAHEHSDGTLHAEPAGGLFSDTATD